jgi:ubiquinone biosynthesis monooxygenase Coq7
VDGLDRLILGVDRFLRTVAGEHHAVRTSPAAESPETQALSADERRHAAGLMRVNHTGEVCAQALYEGQALTARTDDVREALLHAAQEEEDHLAWCRDRLEELESRPSVLNPLFYSASFALGAFTGLLGDRVSLGFVAATEEQVCEHLADHLERLPADDRRSRVVVEAMYRDEARHGTNALTAGGADFPAPVKAFMTFVSKVMTETTYRV